MDFWYAFFQICENAGSVLLIISLCILIVIFVFLMYCFISLFSPSRSMSENGLPKGYYYKELPIDTIKLVFSTRTLSRNDFSGINACCFEICGDICRDLTKNEEQAKESVAHNRQLCEKIEKEFASVLAQDNVCVFGWEDYFYADYWQRSNDLNIAMKNWFEKHRIVKNADGQIAAVIGLSVDTVEIMKKIGMEYDECYYELAIIDVSEAEFLQMTADEIEKLGSNEHYKFKVNNGGFNSCCFEIFNTPGYTKNDMIQKVKEFAESKGYKFKITE